MSGARKRAGVRAMRLMIGLTVMVAAIAFGCDGRCQAQLQQPTGAGQGTNRPTHVTPAEVDEPLGGNPGNPVYQERRLRQLNAAEHKQMVSDTAKLVKLVTELNAEINKTAPADLTPDELRKVAEIEKLAHSVKDKMRTSVMASPIFTDNGPVSSFGTVPH